MTEKVKKRTKSENKMKIVMHLVGIWGNAAQIEWNCSLNSKEKRKKIKTKKKNWTEAMENERENDQKCETFCGNMNEDLFGRRE